MDDSSLDLKAKKAAYMRRWYSKNAKKVQNWVSRWQKKNPEKVRAFQRLTRIRHKEDRKNYDKKWANANRVRLREKYAARRALAKNKLTEIYEELSMKTFCYWCNRILTKGSLHIDHVTPLSRGGQHSKDNLVASCAMCNRSKADKLYWEWDGELAS